MTKAWHPQKSFILEKYYSPQDLKDLVATSVYLDSVIEAIKSTMGRNPVMFLPTHRSYADFCLMTYLCYHYDIDFPAVAAGMDFYSMVILGRRMRETCAFYIRRTLVGAPLYAATLKQYVRTLVAKSCAPIEFFLEGTRSRSNKSLSPKYGMLSMMLMPFFAREVNDITIVPVNITYDRLMEQALFAYEHLGVPKPKESTGGFLKALRSLNDHFGNIYINLGSPLSVKDYIQNDYNISEETLKPLDLQQLTPEQFSKVQDIANYAVTLQQKNTVVVITNLISIVLMQSLIKNELLSYDEVLKEVHWVVNLLKNLGASVFENDVKSSVDRILVVHSKMIALDKDKRLRLISGTLMDMSDEVKAKMKGHILKAETMVNAVPIVQLQLYVNPVLHYLVPPAVVSLLVQRSVIHRDELVADFNGVRKLLKHEFFFVDRNEDVIFSNALEYCIHSKVIAKQGDTYVIGADHKLQFLLKWSISPFLTTILICMDVMIEIHSCDHNKALKMVQERVESRHVHPYCLSLECIGNCLQGLTLAGALAKDKTEKNDVQYTVATEKMKQSHQLITSILPPIEVNFGRRNDVVLDFRTVSSRL
ncbi:dihydroxyacetone phosphate acyltransferase isoform X2 [Hyposmocoma kahamanoa]|uniref:dihydroxyacetone phosphate acyltransferase isoform X2 n=1 Tax=Hyposmocoma kahamanoa TaxID=1477025 RepID=UPI000E6D95F4|nr:dihydroxyacetone phosphate acyltransferase isoform X2 [Hyposmocoma kahamanoa]